MEWPGEQRGATMNAYIHDIYIYIYMYVYMYVYVYTYIYIHKDKYM